MATVQEKAMCVLWFFRKKKKKSFTKMQRRYRTEYGKAPPSDNTILRWLKQYQKNGNVLYRKGARRPSTLHEDVDRIQEAFSPSPYKSSRRAFCS
jgi:DNA-binding PadR family transcriptional regulator